MKFKTKIFTQKNQCRGGTLVELLLSVALATIAIPFVFNYQHRAIERTQNIAIAKQMNDIQGALERYIIAHREKLLMPVGQNITRVDISELTSYGVPQHIVTDMQGIYQLRIVKSSDAGGNASLQGVVIRTGDDVTPMRTREIVGLSGGTMGFVDGTHAYGTFGAWHTDAIDLGTDIDDAIIETTAVNRDSALYLWRIPTKNPDDAKMMAALNLSGHDIGDATFINANTMDFSEDITATNISARDITFQNRTTIDRNFKSNNATVSGIFASDSKDINIANTLTIADTAKTTSVNAEKLWVSNLTLGGLSVSADDDLAILNVNQSIDMTAGRINAMFVTVGFSGSISPKLVVYDKVADSVQNDFCWDAKNKTANFMDASFVELNRMATLAIRYEGDMTTESGQLFNSVSANKNATVADFMNVINEIQIRVQNKYRMLNL